MPKYDIIGQTLEHSATLRQPISQTMTETDGEILTLDEVAAYLKAGKKTVYRLAQQGQIPSFKLGGTWRFRRIELDRWIAEQIADKAQNRT
jgi:excisionase family DNA binding protein